MKEAGIREGLPMLPYGSRTSRRSTASLIPSGVKWIKSQVQEFSPDKNCVRTDDGKEISYEYLIVALGLKLHYEKISYEYLIVALGLKLHYEKIKGLPEGFNYPKIGSNYSVETVDKTWKALQDFKEGNAIFTLPNTPVKCAGAPQKIMYLADSYFRKEKHYGLRLAGLFCFVYEFANVVLPSCYTYRKTLHWLSRLSVLLVIPEQRDQVSTSGQQRDQVSLTLIKAEITGLIGIAYCTFPHRTFVTNAIYYHEYCVCTAQKALQHGVLFENSTHNQALQVTQYDGYTSCPLVTSYNTVILAEFDYNGQPLETFPIDQSKERMSMFYMKADVMPHLYWHGLLKGFWGGPGPYRKIMHLGMK
ncbi:UNVERIFIED_CONTAM: hypothetical protein FKN15_016722 [Acipenser sinensis]